MSKAFSAAGDEIDQMVVDGDIPVILRRSGQAKRMTLRVPRLGGPVVLTLPRHATRKMAHDFAQSRAAWLRSAQQKVPPAQYIRPDAMIPVEGRALRIMPTALRRIKVDGDALMVPEGAAMGPVIAAWMKHLARDRLVAASDHYGAKLGRSFRAITLRDTKSRWGSCTHDGRLMYSWRLIMAPPDVLRYVAAHEVSHLAHMDHSDRFWATVESLMPDYATPRRWLRDHGNDLLIWRFGND